MIKSRQVIESYFDCKSNHPNWSEMAIEDYQALKDDIFTFISLVNNGELSPQFGTGSPEGLIVSNYSLKYIDTSIPTEYYNPVYGSKTGWIAL